MKPLTQTSLTNAMKKLLSHYNTTPDPVTGETIHKDILSDTDGIGASNSKNLYYGSVKWTLWNADHKNKNKKFPADWMNLSVSDVAEKLLLTLFLFISSFCFSQEVKAQKPVKLELGVISTPLKQGAINLAFSYLRNLDSAWKQNGDYFIPSKKSFLLVAPDLNIKTGTNDALSSVVLKVTALTAFFHTEFTKDSVEIPNLGSSFFTMPISVGVEADAGFKNLNGIFEIGYIPQFKNVPIKFGVFAQTGYKFNLDSSGLLGGKIYQGKEKNKSLLARAKGSLSVNTPMIHLANFLAVGLTGFSEGWYDIVNSAVYYKVSGALRIYLSPNTHFDLKYEKGSGEPLFNKGEQYGANLVLSF